MSSTPTDTRNLDTRSLDTRNLDTQALDSQVTALKTRLAAAQRAKLRAEGERDAATTAAEQARALLAAEFGVATAAEASAMLTSLETDLTGHLDQITAELDEAGL